MKRHQNEVRIKPFWEKRSAVHIPDKNQRLHIWRTQWVGRKRKAAAVGKRGTFPRRESEEGPWARRTLPSQQAGMPWAGREWCRRVRCDGLTAECGPTASCPAVPCVSFLRTLCLMYSIVIFALNNFLFKRLRRERNAIDLDQFPGWFQCPPPFCVDSGFYLASFSLCLKNVL